MYNSVYQHYKERLQKDQAALSETKKKLYSLGTIRLLVFVGTIVAAYFLRSFGAGMVTPILLFGIILFLYLLIQYNKQQKKKHYLETSISCCESELKGLDYDFSSFDGAKEKVDASHSFGLDLDIFGNNSLFQSINRTCTNYGKKVLVRWFEKPLQDPQPITNRQEAVKELKEKTAFLHHFRVLGLISPGKESDYKEINDFVNSPDCIASRKMWKTIGILTPCLWVTLIVLSAMNLFPATFFAGIYILFLIISESQAKKVNQLQMYVGKKVNILQSYSNLIETVEQETFQSEQLKELQSRFFQENQKASVRFKRLATLANELEQRANLVVHLLLNPLMIWDIRKAIQIEDWKSKNSKEMIGWIECLGEFDAFCSLGKFGFNHPDTIFPALTNDYFEMKGKNIRHPLMNRSACIGNDIEIEKHPFFMIITGANMAGKSTYLRTVGVNYVLACVGAPVCAESFTLYPAALVTSLRTSDSLLDNESYFFAELKRLKMIIDRLHNGEKLFIILDEILKGTNSVDKQKGSLALVQQFIHLQSCGIIATHDLLLGSLEKEFPNNVKNYRFEADIKNEELSFSYKLREGIAQNMNASFLMNKMGITVNR